MEGAGGMSIMIPKTTEGAGPRIFCTKRRIRVMFGEAEPDKVGYTRNISATGLNVETNQAMAPGTGLQLTVDTGEEMFELWATVVWARRFPPRYAQVMRGGMGCRFLDTSAEWVEFYERWKAET